MRLDRFLSDSGTATRSEAARAVRRGAVTVNGTVAKSPAAPVDPERDLIVFAGVEVVWKPFLYIMLNKPQGYVSATDDGGRAPVVLELLPDSLRRRNLFPCGRLDKYTTGLMLLTDNGQLAHRLLSPRHHVPKQYAWTAARPVTPAEKEALESGVHIEGGYLTKPAKVELEGDGARGTIVLTEGKYHQIKQMFYATGNEIVTLSRRTFGPLTLDEGLAPGAWRELTAEEIRLLEDAGT
jgi:16S rRNA pseudouridine516 synthase